MVASLPAGQWSVAVLSNYHPIYPPTCSLVYRSIVLYPTVIVPIRYSLASLAWQDHLHSLFSLSMNCAAPGLCLKLKIGLSGGCGAGADSGTLSAFSSASWSRASKLILTKLTKLDVYFFLFIY